MNKKIHMKSMKKRILSALLTVVMVISMIPVSAFAADGSVAEVTIGNTTTQYSDLLSAFNAAQYASGSATVKLLDDFENFATGWSRTDGIQLSSGDVTLDLNGHYINRYNNAAGTNANKKAVFYVTGSAKMTVMDSIGGGNIIQPLIEPSMIVDSGASLTVLSGTITNTGAGCGIRIDSGTLAIEGGMVNALYDTGICVGGGTVTVTGDSKIHGGKLNALLITGESSVTLSGGTYTTNGKNKSSILNKVGKVTDLLANGFRFTDANGNDIAITEDGQGTDSDNVTVSDFGIKYIDADGAEQKCTSFTELTDASDGLLNGWYAVTGTVNIEGTIGVTGGGTLNLILCDGATLNLQRILCLLGNATLNIYGQSGGTGTLNVKDTSGQPAIGVFTSTPGGKVNVNIYGGTVTAQALYGAQPIGINPTASTAIVNVTIAKGLKCVKTDEQNTAYPYDNTDDTSITITKCTEHKWSYANITDDGHDQTCDLCGTTETGVKHTTARYSYIRADIHSLICACGKRYSTEHHTYTYAPNSDGLTHTATCMCEYAVDDIQHTYKGENKVCICGAIHSATYDGKNYASLQSAIDAAATVGGTVTLAQQINENVVVTDGTVTIDLGGNRWSANTDVNLGEVFVPLTVNGGNVTLKNGNLFQGWSSSSARTGIEINDGSVTVGEDVSVMGGVPDRNTKCPSITLNGGSLILKEGAALLTGLQVPEGKVLADYLTEGTTFVKGSYDYGSNTVTISDPQEFVPDIYTANKITEGMVIVSHTHDFGTGACACGFDCDHSKVDEATGKCENCNTQIYVATLTKADGTKQEYKSFSEAWSAAVENEGSTLKLLCGVDLDESGFTLDHGKFTLDLGGFTIECFAYQQVFEISGTADITIKNGNMFNTINPANMQGDLTPSEGVVIALNGGTLTLDSVTLKGGTPRWGYASEICWSISVSGGCLVADNSTFNGAVSIAIFNGEANPEIKITSANLNNGFSYGFIGDKYAPDVVKSFFAEGSMLFDKDGKYIDVGDESYWMTDGDEENPLTGFIYSEECVVKPHTHTFVDGKCSECDYACPHDSGKNDREASYFEKAICSICHCEYGDYAQDTTAPTGEIKIKERTWWQSLLNTISFGLFYKEEVQVEITADDDSYQQAGYDESKHAVKMEYLISDTALSEAEVKGSEFTEYTGAIDLSKDDQYVIYAKLTDHAGNVAYASTDGFEIDTTAPVIEGYANGQEAHICGYSEIKFVDKNFESATITRDGNTEKIWSKSYGFDPCYGEQWYTVEVTDKAGNITKNRFYLHNKHSFDLETGVCDNCGYQATALIKYVNASNEEKIAFGNSFDNALRNVENRKDTETAVLRLYRDAEKSNGWSTYFGSGKWILDLNGHAINNPRGANWDTAFFQIAQYGDVTIVGDGAMNVYTLVSVGASLTVDGNCSFYKMEQQAGTLNVNSGSFESLIVAKLDVNYPFTRETKLCGGYYGDIKIVDIEGLTCADLLGSGYRFEGLTFEQAKVTELKNVTVVTCDHANIGSDGSCPDCGKKFFLSVEVNGTTTLFDTFESAIRYAEQNDGSTVKLLQDITLSRENADSLIYNYFIYLGTGTYTLDLAGKTLTIEDGQASLQGLLVTGGCNLTVTDTIGGGKVKSSRRGEVFGVRSDSHLTIERGDYTELSKVWANGPDSLTIKGGKFQCINSREGSDSVSPLTYLADDCAFMLSSGVYANESNVESEYISGQGTTYWIDDVTVVSAPLKFNSPPRDDIYYLTMPNYEKWAIFTFLYSGGYPSKGDITITGERIDGTVVHTNTIKPTRIFQDGIKLWDFTTEDSGQFRIKLEYNGYVLYSNTFTITMAVCEHPDYYEDYGYKCSQCYCDLAAAIVKDGKTMGYVDFADALAAAQTDENKGCTLKVLADVNEKIAVKTGSFTLDATNRTIKGALNVAKSADLTVSGGVITGNVICAKGGKLTASNTYFAGAINCVGEGEFRNCNLAGTVAGKGGLKLYSCEIPGNLSISGNAEAEECIVSGTVTVNNGGSFKSTGDTYRNTINVKSGGTLEMISGICDKKLTAESGSKLIISGGSYTEIEAGNNVDFTINDGKFTKITVAGKLIDCLAEGKAFEDMNNGFIIDGRVGIAGDVKVVDHTHTCVWNTTTHEKLCGCGYVEATDTEAPVISGIEFNGAYYGPTEFTVTDASEFTVTLDGEPITLENGKYTVKPDNGCHTVIATDVAGNTESISFWVYKIYNVTLPTGVGYTIKINSDGTTAKHGSDYAFEVKIAPGYSKTENYKVLVNGKEPDGATVGVGGGSYSVHNVSSDLVITVEGVADITPPKAEINIDSHTFKDFISRITFGLFYKETQTVSVIADDQGSGVSRVEYLLSETAFTDKDAITGNWTELTLDEYYQASFDIEPNNKAYVYVRATDVSGNITVINSDGVVVYTDSEAVTDAVNFTMRDDKDVSFEVKLNGNTVKALYNGETVIDNSNYTVSEDGTITLKNSYISTLAAGEYTIRVEYNPMGESYKNGDTPLMTSVKLTVEKKLPTLNLEQRTEKIYDGNPIDTSKISSTVITDGDLVWEFKSVDADDTAYTTTAPKNVGIYNVRLTAAETDVYKGGSVTTVYEITSKEVTISDVKVENRVYDGTTVAKITSAGTMNGVVDGDDVAIVAGKANFNDKNVGTDKIVTFTDFKLSGDDVANYVLASQPASTTASISAKKLTITDLKVKDKQYDGKNNAEIDGTPALDGVVDGDDITLVNGIPTFDSVTIGENIPISFTEFMLSGDSTTVGNYTLTQPSGITANIMAYVVDGSEYDVNSNDWINSDFTITAKEGYKLSLTDTADGEWTDTLTASDETDSGKLTFYVKNTATGVISTAVTENYKIDKSAPTGEIRINERTTFRDFLNKITFGLFFKKTQTVGVTAQDTGSGLAKVEYLLSEKAFEDKDTVAGDWTELTLMGGKASFAIEPNKKAYIYLRMTDVSGNVQIINSEGVVVYTDSEAITENVNFTMLDDNDVNFSVKLNGNTVKALYNGETVIDDSNYTVSEDGTITLKNSYVSTLAAGEYTIRVAYDPMGESYVAGDEPAMTSVKLAVEKRMPTFSIAQRTERAYDGTPISVDSVVTTNGDLVWEYKPVDTDDTAYTTTAPKNVGIYTVRLTALETDVYKEASVTTIFEITPKELTIAGLKVKDKQYDGKNNAEIDGTPALDGVVDGDDITLVNGIPTFDSVTTGENISISFTEFALSGDSATVGNYTLTQPSGITANIMAYVADGSEYDVNSNDWINNDFVITAKEGYKLSLTDTADGEWTDTLTASDETSDGELTFYVKNTATGVISTAVTENYKIDRTMPTGEIKVNENTTFSDFMNDITLGLFFKKTLIVDVTAQDAGSGLAKVEYLLSEKTFEDKDAVDGDWTELTLADGKASFAIEPNKKAYIYLRMTDVSGNVQVINSEGVVVYTDSEAITENVNFTMLDHNDVNFEVKLNGNTVKALYNGETVIDSSDYTVSENGTITLKNSYVSTLAAGEYTIRVAYNPLGESYVAGDEPTMTSVKLAVEKKQYNGTDNAEINGKDDKSALGEGVDGSNKHSATKNAETTNTPKTGDESNFALWIALLFISGGVGTGTAAFRRKKKLLKK